MTRPAARRAHLLALVVASALAVAFVPAPGAAARARQSPVAPAPFFFIQLTDPQLGMFADNASADQEKANLEFAVATINRLRPAFVVVTGDLVNRTADEAQIAAYLGILDKIDSSIRVYNLPGNHDVGNAPTPESLAAYVKRFGPDHYVFRHANFAGIVLNSVLMHTPGKAAQAAAEQDRWLRSELERARRDGVRHVVVFEHHPVFVEDQDEADGYENIPRVRRQAYLALLAEYGVTHVFAGHLHHNAVVRAGKLEIVGTGPIGKPLGDGAKSGMRLVTVTERGIEHRFCELGDLPNRVEFAPR